VSRTRSRSLCEYKANPEPLRTTGRIYQFEANRAPRAAPGPDQFASTKPIRSHRARPNGFANSKPIGHRGPHPVPITLRVQSQSGATAHDRTDLPIRSQSGTVGRTRPRSICEYEANPEPPRTTERICQFEANRAPWAAPGPAQFASTKPIQSHRAHRDGSAE
jgi:hypothetical protein